MQVVDSYIKRNGLHSRNEFFEKAAENLIADEAIIDSVESLKTLEESLQNWLQVFKFPAVERTTYDRAESIAKNQIYPQLGKKIVGDITAADVKKLLNYWMTEDYAYTTVKKVYTLLNEYFRYLYQQEFIARNPMANVEMLKKANFMSAQGKENLPPTETITVFSEEEVEKFKKEAFSVFGNGKRKYQQAAAYVLMLNTGLRTGEALGLVHWKESYKQALRIRYQVLFNEWGDAEGKQESRRCAFCLSGFFQIVIICCYRSIGNLLNVSQ